MTETEPQTVIAAATSICRHNGGGHNCDDGDSNSYSDLSSDSISGNERIRGSIGGNDRIRW